MCSLLKAADLELVHDIYTSGHFFFFLDVNLYFWTTIKANEWVLLYANMQPGCFDG